MLIVSPITFIASDFLSPASCLTTVCKFSIISCTLSSVNHSFMCDVLNLLTSLTSSLIVDITVEVSSSGLSLASFIFASDSESLSFVHGVIFMRPEAPFSSSFIDMLHVVSPSSSLLLHGISPGSNLSASSSSDVSNLNSVPTDHAVFCVRLTVSVSGRGFRSPQ